MANVLGGCFYVISASALMSFLAKYLEVQFGTSPGGGAVITGNFNFASDILSLILYLKFAFFA